MSLSRSFLNFLEFSLLFNTQDRSTYFKFKRIIHECKHNIKELNFRLKKKTKGAYFLWPIKEVIKVMLVRDVTAYIYLYI